MMANTASQTDPVEFGTIEMDLNPDQPQPYNLNKVISEKQDAETSPPAFIILKVVNSADINSSPTHTNKPHIPSGNRRNTTIAPTNVTVAPL